MNDSAEPLASSSVSPVGLVDDERRRRLLAAAPRLARLLLRLEEDAYADAQPCPFCYATDDVADGLPHAVDCELDRALFDAGLRVGPPLES